MDANQIREFQTAVGKADWNLNLDRFAEVMGLDPRHGYTQEKFRRLAALNKALNQFDAETLAKIVNAA